MNRWSIHIKRRWSIHAFFMILNDSLHSDYCICFILYIFIHYYYTEVDKGLLDRLNNINKTLNNQWNRLQNIKNTVDNTGAQADRARNQVRDAENLINTAREELDKAKEAISKVVRRTISHKDPELIHSNASKMISQFSFP